MADFKSTRSRRGKKEIPYRQILDFPQVKGKVILGVEVGISTDENSITLYFQDDTALCFDVEPCLTIMPEFADIKGDWKQIKRWPAMHSRTSTDWP